MYGILEYNNNLLKKRAMENNYLITLDMLVDYILNAQKAKMDAHLIIGGQNGLGKSYLQLALAKTTLRILGEPLEFSVANEKSKLRFFFASNTRPQLMRAIKEMKRSVFVIDELRPFFDYKRSMTREQTELYNSVEIARSNSNVYIGASRDYTKLDKNYRNAKAQLLIYLIDKVVDMKQSDGQGFFKTKFTYGAVFVGNPSLEHEDKFMFSSLRGYSLETTKYLAEKLPTWVGNIIVKPIQTYGITDADLQFYDEEKEKGIKTFGEKKTEEGLDGKVRDEVRRISDSEDGRLHLLRGKRRVRLPESDQEDVEESWGFIQE